MEELIPCLSNEIARECLIRVPPKKLATIVKVSKSWRAEVQSWEFHQKRMAEGFTRSIIVLIQCKTLFTLFDPDTGMWSKLNPPSIPGFSSEELPPYSECVGVGRNLVVVGGMNPVTTEFLKTMFVYDFVSASWSRGVNMPGEPRLWFACAADSNKGMVLVAGGIGVKENALNSAMAYDVATDKWVSLPDMKRPKMPCKGIFDRGKFQVTGWECILQDRYKRNGEALDVETLQWERVDDLQIFYLIGNRRNMYRCDLSNLLVLENKEWITIAVLPDNVRCSPYMIIWQENLLVIGRGEQSFNCNAYIFERNYCKWTKIKVPKQYSGNVNGGCSLEI